MNEKVLGKIEKASYGFGGYDGAMFGLSITLSLNGGTTGVADFKGWWKTYPKGANYTEEEWQNFHLESALFVKDLLVAAKKSDVSKLVGVPVEAVIEDNTLKSWRVLEEVL